MSTDHIDPLSGIPLSRLRVFDAAARHNNLVRAAADLKMTQGAVSRHIKSLEAHLGVSLFQRGPRGVTLTESGDLLFDYVHRAFDELSFGLQRLGQPRQRTTLVVAAPRSFALRVLAPRLGRFVHQHPWIDLRVDTHRYYADLSQSSRDVAIRAGDGRWSDLAVERLTNDVVFPVCAPALWTATTRTASAATFLRDQTLLHYAERPYWPTWLRQAKLDPTIGQSGPTFSETAMALTAAESAQGVAIGRLSLVADALAEGRLVRPFRTVVEDGISYFLVVRRHSVRSSMVKRFIEWLLTEMAALNMHGGDAEPARESTDLSREPASRLAQKADRGY